MTFAVNFFSNTRVSDLWVDAQIFPDNNSRLVFLATAHELKFWLHAALCNIQVMNIHYM